MRQGGKKQHAHVSNTHMFACMHTLKNFINPNKIFAVINIKLNLHSFIKLPSFNTEQGFV